MSFEPQTSPRPNPPRLSDMQSRILVRIQCVSLENLEDVLEIVNALSPKRRTSRCGVLEYEGP